MKEKENRLQGLKENKRGSSRTLFRLKLSRERRAAFLCKPASPFSFSKTLSLLFVCLFTKSERQVHPMHPEFQPLVCGCISRFLDQNGKQRARLTSGSGAPPTGSSALSILWPLPAHTSHFLESSGGIHLIPLMC